MLKTLNNLDNKIKSFLCNKIIKTIIIILLVNLLIRIKNIPLHILSLFKEPIMRIIITLVIAYVACIDPLIAILITSAFIMSLQENHNRESKIFTNNVTRNIKQDIINVESESKNPIFLEEKILKDNKNIDKKLNQDDYDLENHPSDKTLMDNVNSYISNKHLNDAQNNNVNGNDPDKPIQVFPDILNAQGINLPSGFDSKSYTASEF
tara:strand:- start:358 stop:981 length:624 start_codon:yes stop_codon:yes gene_type:complete